MKYHKTSALINTNRHTTNRFPNVDRVLGIFVPGDSIVMSIRMICSRSDALSPRVHLNICTVADFDRSKFGFDRLILAWN